MSKKDKKIVLFDIDQVLIDRFRLWKLLTKKIIDTCHISFQKFEETRLRYIENLISSTDFNADEFLRILSKNFDVNLSLLNKIFFEKKDSYCESLFAETVEVLEKLRNKCVLGIFSEGRKKYQMAKLVNSGIFKFFDNNYIGIYRRKLEKSVIDLLPFGAVVVDDRKYVVEKLSKRKDLIVYWLDREKSDDSFGLNRIGSLVMIKYEVNQRIGVVDYMKNDQF